MPVRLPEAIRMKPAEEAASQGMDSQSIRPRDEHPQDIESLQKRVRAYAGRGDLEGALTCCRQAIDLDDMNPTNHYLLAIIHTESRQYEAAADVLRRVLYLDPNHVLAHVALGDLHRQRGHPAKANRYWQNALTLLKTYPPAQVLPESGGMTAKGLAETLRHTNL